MSVLRRTKFFAVGLLVALALLVSLDVQAIFAQTCQCAEWAIAKRSDITGKISGAGCAANWPQKMRDNGYPHQVGTVPVKGSLVVFRNGVHRSDPNCGHVAYVENVNGDGTFAISEKGRPAGSCTVRYDRTRLSVESGVEFLYGVNDIPGGTQPTPVPQQPTATPVPAFPNLHLARDVSWSPSPAVAGQQVTFKVPVVNRGGAFTMSKMDIAVTAPSGGEWKTGNGNAVSIAAGGTADIYLSGILWNESGNWKIKDIPYMDASGAWRSVGIGDNRLLYRDIQVNPPVDTSRPVVWVTSPQAGTVFRTGTMRVFAEGAHAGGDVVEVHFVLIRNGAWFASIKDGYGGDGWWKDFENIPQGGVYKVKAHAFTSQRVEGISEEIGPLYVDWTPPEISISVPSTAVGTITVGVSYIYDHGSGMKQINFHLGCPSVNYGDMKVDANLSDGWGPMTFPLNGIPSGTVCRIDAYAYDVAGYSTHSNVVEFRAN